MTPPQTQTTDRLNDVDIATVAGLADQYKQDPQAGVSKWNARVQWLGGFRSEGYIRDQAPIRSDEPDWLAGTDTGPNAVEIILSAFGSCLAVGYAANATARGIRIESLEFGLEGEIDLPVFLGLVDGNAGYNRIKIDVYIRADATPEELQELTDHVFKTSPVGTTLARPVQLVPNLVSEKATA